MSLVAKFHLSDLSTAHINGGKAKFSAVSRGDKNASWCAASPSGEMEIHLDESEFQWVLQRRDIARAVHAARMAAVEAENERSGVAKRLPHIGVEVFLYLTREPRNGSITRLLNLDSVSSNPQWPGQGACEWTSLNGGGWTKLRMQINNPPAYEQMRSAHHEGKLEWYLSINPSTDGYAGDGHAFRESVYPEGIWGYGLCGECFGKPDEH